MSSLSTEPAARGDAVEAVGEPSADMETEHLGLHHGPSELADLLGRDALGVALHLGVRSFTSFW